MKKAQRRGHKPVNEPITSDPRDPGSWGVEPNLPSGKKREAESDPIANMLARGGLNADQVFAAREIETAFGALLHGKLILRASCLDDGPRGSGRSMEPTEAAIDRERRYKAWATEMAVYNKRYNGNRPVLPVMIDVVWDRRQLAEVGRDYGFDHRKIARLINHGLDEYIRIAGWKRRQAA